jgi:hypothetical protein
MFFVKDGRARKTYGTFLKMYHGIRTFWETLRQIGIDYYLSRSGEYNILISCASN